MRKRIVIETFIYEYSKVYVGSAQLPLDGQCLVRIFEV